MAANLYQKSFTNLSGQLLSDEPLVMDATIIIGQQSVTSVTVRFLGSAILEASWPPGATVHLKNVDLSMIEVDTPFEVYCLVVGQSP